jgi:Transglycosylase SLT domain
MGISEVAIDFIAGSYLVRETMAARLNIMVLALLLGAGSAPCFAGETATLRNGFTIHYERREALGETTRLYLAPSADSFVDVPSDDILEIEADKTPATNPPARTPPVPYPVRIDEALSAASQKHNVSPELLRSVVRVESGFNPHARSAKGAQGLMQLMPATAARMGVRDVFDPAENLDGGARYLRELLGRYNNNLSFALAAYNAGPERVEQYHGVPPFPETIAYVNRIVRDFNRQNLSGRNPLTEYELNRTRTSGHPSSDKPMDGYFQASQ